MYVCIIFVHMYVNACGGQSSASGVASHELSTLLLGASHWFGRAGWTVNTRYTHTHPASPPLGLQVCASAPSFVA